MAISGVTAEGNLPYNLNIEFAQALATGNISVGDWLAYSGQFVRAQFSGGAPGTAYWKASGAGVALDSNPMYDRFGNQVQNSAMRILVEGAIWVSGLASGQPGLGVGAYPVSTGSAAYAPTGRTGLGATWQTAEVVSISAMSGTAGPRQPAVGTVIASRNFGNAGTGEWLVRLMALAPDVRG